MKHFFVGRSTAVRPPSPLPRKPEPGHVTLAPVKQVRHAAIACASLRRDTQQSSIPAQPKSTVSEESYFGQH